MTTDDSEPTTRRTVLRATGAAGTIALVGGIGIVASSGSATAASANITANSVSATNADGDVTELYIDPQGGVEWEDFDEPVDAIRVTIESRVTDADGAALSGWRSVYDRTFELGDHAGLAGDFDGARIGEAALYGDGAGDTTYFDVDDDGRSVRRRVELRFTVNLLHGDGLADPREHAHIVEEVAFYADSENAAASSGVTGRTNGGMN